jgi:prepilin-type processing-associated H-X9-DG protein
MISGVMNTANKKSYNLQNVAKILNVLKADGHVSLADIEMTGKVLTQSVKFIKNHSSHLDDDYIKYEKKSRKNYRDKLNWFHSQRNQFNDSYKTKKKFIDMVEKDVHNGTLSYIQHLEAKADNERTGGKKYAILRDLQLKTNQVKRLLSQYSGDSKEIISFIYNN